MNIIEKIQREIDKEIVKTGKSGSEIVTVRILLSQAAKKLFLDTDQFDTSNYCWEFEDSLLIISYTEEVED